MTVNVVCLKFGNKYGPEYVNRLFYAVRRHTNVPFNFHCFTERPKGIHDDVVIHTLPHKHIDGWWHKLYMFEADEQVGGKIFYLDLDTLVTGNLDAILKKIEELDSGHLITLHDFFRIMRPTNKDRFGLGKDAVGSGVLGWEAGKHKKIWTSFAKDPKRAIQSLHPHGDQKWIEAQEPKRLYWQDLFPNQFVSFKVHCRKGLPKNARIVCYHGKPSIPESINQTTRVQGYNIPPTKWVADHWKDE